MLYFYVKFKNHTKMENETICPNCGETVETGWDTCWNCLQRLDAPFSADSDKSAGEKLTD